MMDATADLLAQLSSHGAVHPRDRNRRWKETPGEITATAIALVRNDPDTAVGPLQEIRVGLVDPGPKWHASGGWGQNPHRLGGPPSWIQAPFYPQCPICTRQMQFLLQLDGRMREVGVRSGRSGCWSRRR